MRKPGEISDAVKTGQIAAVIRLGSDFINNFYEIRIPLIVTPWGRTLPDNDLAGFQ